MSDHNQPVDQIEADIARQREQLAESVDALHHKLDVKARAQDKAAELKDRATTPAGKPRPEVAAAAGAAVLLLVLMALRKRKRARQLG